MLHAEACAIRELQFYFANCGESRITSRVMLGISHNQKPSKIKPSSKSARRKLRRMAIFMAKRGRLRAGISIAQVNPYREHGGDNHHEFTNQ
jgi:hypothetical protein